MSRWSGRLAVVVAVALASGAKAPAEDMYPRETLPATCGGQLALDQARGKQATVLVCLSTDCPITTEYMPTIVALAAEYQPRGVSFVGINPNGGQTLEQMADYARQHKLEFAFVQDPGGKVSRRLLFSVTPEVRVYDAAGKLVYSGRIDDRYRRGAGSDGNVTRDLANALDELLAGKPVSASRTKAVGCPIQITAPQSANQ